MSFWKRKPIPHSKTYTKAVSRLRTVSDDEVLRYMDTVHSHLGQLIQDIRKSPPEEALQILDDVENSAEVVNASAAVLRSRKE